MLNQTHIITLLAILLIIILVKLYIEGKGISLKELFISSINNDSTNSKSISPRTQFDRESLELEKAMEDIKGKINKAVEEGFIEAFQQMGEAQTHDQKYDALDDTLMKSKTSKILLFYSKSCPHCSEFLPTWYRIVNDLPNNTLYEEIEVNEKPSLAGQYGITEVPTIILLLDNEKHPFVGARNYENINRFLRNQGINLVARTAEQFSASGYDNTPEPTGALNANCPAVTFNQEADIANDRYFYQIFNETGQYGHAEGGNKYDKVLSPFAAAYSVVDSYLSSLPDKTNPAKSSYSNVNECANLYATEIRQFGLCDAAKLNNILNYEKKVKSGNGKMRFSGTDYSTNEKVVNAIKSACQFSK